MKVKINHKFSKDGIITGYLINWDGDEIYLTADKFLRLVILGMEVVKESK